MTFAPYRETNMLNNNLATNILNEYKNDSITLAQAIDMLNILYTHPNPINTSTDTLEIPGNSPEIIEEIHEVTDRSNVSILSKDRYVVTELLKEAGIENTKANQIRAARVLKDSGYIRMKSNGNVFYISREEYNRKHNR